MNIIIHKKAIYFTLILAIIILCCSQVTFAAQNEPIEPNQQQISIIEEQEVPQVIMPTNNIQGFEFGWLIPFSVFALAVVGGLLYYLCKPAKHD